MDEREPICVLLVDDSEADYGVVRRHLARSTSGGFALEWVPTLEEALARMGRGGVDVFLVDYRLGLRTGLDALDQMRQHGIRLPVILLTGLGDLSVAMEAMRRGAIDYLDKNDLSPALLERSISYAIENFRIREELRQANESLEARVRARTAELERSNRELEEFASLVSHELELPLKTITAQLERLLDNPDCIPTSDDPDLAAYFLHRAHGSALRMQELVREVLAYSRVGGTSLTPSPVSLTTLLENVLGELDGLIRESSASITLGTLPKVQGEATLLERLFRNLVHNGLKYGAQPPAIYVWAEPHAEGWLCGVRNNGPGIGPDEREIIFTMFHRAPRQQAKPGHGIGLALCKRIVEHHGGHIWVESEPDLGTTFFFTLATAVPNAFETSHAPPVPQKESRPQEEAS